MADQFNLETAAALLEMQSDALLLVHGRVIAYQNHAARELLCGDLTGERATKLIPAPLMNLQSGGAIAAARIAGQDLTLAVSTVGLYRLYTLRPLSFPVGTPSVPTSVWTHLANLRMLSERIGDALTATGTAENRLYAAKLTKLYYTLNAQLINETLLAQLRDGTTPFQPRVVECGEQLRSVLPRLRTMLQAQGVELRAEIAEGKHYCRADGVLISRMLLNLLCEGIQRCRPGDYLRLSMAKTGEFLVITLHDSGAGYRPEALRRMLDAQEDPGRSLAAVLGVAALHGCTFTLESASALGTTARLLLLPEPAPRGATLRQESADSAKHIEQMILTALAPALPAEAYLGVTPDASYR